MDQYIYIFESVQNKTTEGIIHVNLIKCKQEFFMIISNFLFKIETS